MSTPAAKSKRKKILPTLIAEYSAALQGLAHQNALYEMGTRPALLQAVAKDHKWTLIAQHEKKDNGRMIHPDCPSEGIEVAVRLGSHVHDDQEAPALRQ